MTAALQRAATGIGNPAVIAVIRELGYRKVCATWAPKILIVDTTLRERTQHCAELLQHSEEDGDVYVRNNNNNNNQL
jgi:hypothetical protein